MSAATVIKSSDQSAGRLALFHFAAVEEQAQQILEQARATASRLLTEAEAELERRLDTELASVRDEAYAKGYESGLLDGRAEGAKQGRSEGAAAARAEFQTLSGPVAQALEELLKQLNAHRTELIHDAQNDLLRLALSIASRVVRRDLSADRAAVVQAAALLSQLADRSRIEVRLNEADVEAMREALPELHHKFIELSEVELVPDNRLPRGAMQLRGGAGFAEFNPDDALDALARAVLESESP